MRTYHFNLGNSGSGPVGFCADIRAASKPKALQKLRDILEDRLNDEHEVFSDSREYLTVYFNPDYITVKDIDEVKE